MRAQSPPATASEAPKFKELMLEAQEAALARVEEIVKQLPLEFLLGIMRDESYPPGVRIECAKAALPFCHAKKADEPSDKVQQVTEIRRLIVQPESNTDHPRREEISREAVEPGVDRSAMPAEPEPGDRHWAADEPDAVTRARSRLDKMCGVN